MFDGVLLLYHSSSLRNKLVISFQTHFRFIPDRVHETSSAITKSGRRGSVTTSTTNAHDPRLCGFLAMMNAFDHVDAVREEREREEPGIYIYSSAKLEIDRVGRQLTEEKNGARSSSDY
jgi:hypothetical protein